MSSIDIEQITSKLQGYSLTLKSQFMDLDDNPCDVLCLLCDLSFVLPSKKQDFLTHLFNEHRLVIADVDKIASLKSYIRYWRVKFQEQPLTAFCTTLTSNSSYFKSEANDSNKEFYFLLSDCLSEDKTLRDELQRAKLDWVLSEQVKERSDTTFKRACMFCRNEFSGSRLEYVKHLSEKHSILLGKPEHLVFIDEYLDKIQANIESLICIYCERTFKNRLVLKDHMRKKLHRQVNPHNKVYDKYYVTNYISDKSNEKKRKTVKSYDIETEDPSGFSSGEDEDWSDWINESISITCLFCSEIMRNFDAILQHMKSEHNFDFKLITNEFTFYQKVKMVNYIRKQIYTSRCVYCDNLTESLNTHMDEENHYKLPAESIWNQSEFYFPMFESDSFLYNLDDNSDIDE